MTPAAIATDNPTRVLADISHQLTLAQLKFGPFSFVELRRELIRQNGFDEVATDASCDLTLLGPAWLSSSALAAGLNSSAAAFQTASGSPVATGSKASPSAATEQLDNAVLVNHPWQLLDVAKLAAGDLDLSRLSAAGCRREGSMIDGSLWCGEGTTVLPGVYVEGTVVIGRNCKIGPNCYLRGPIFIGDNCRIGQAVEIKASVIMDDSAVGHLSYVGDSVIGNRVNFGAGTITANLRHDGTNVRTQAVNSLVDTGRRKLGTIVGDDVHTGIHTAIYPGRKLGVGASTRPGAVVDRDLRSAES